MRTNYIEGIDTISKGMTAKKGIIIGAAVTGALLLLKLLSNDTTKIEEILEKEKVDIEDEISSDVEESIDTVDEQ